MRRSSSYLLSLLLMLAGLPGCQKSPNGNQLSNKKPETHDNWLTITTDSAGIADAIEVARQQRQQTLDAIYSSLGERWGFTSYETIDLLAGNPQAIDQLKSRLGDSREITDTGIGAALLLCQLHVVEGRDYLPNALQNGTVEQRERILNQIDCVRFDQDSEQKYRQFLFANQRLAKTLLVQLDDPNPEIVEAAIQACGILEVPGAHSRLIELLKDPSCPNQSRVMYWLSKGQLTPGTLDLAIQISRKSFSGKKNDDHWETSLFEAFAQSDDPVLRERARDEMKRILAQWPDDGSLGYHGDRLMLLSTLAETAGPGDLDWLRTTFEKERGLYGESILVAISKIEGAAARPRLLKLLDQPDRCSAAITAIGQAFADSADQEIVDKLVAVAEGKKERTVYQICETLQSIGGQSAATALNNLVPNLDAAAQASIRRKMNRDQPPLSEIAARIVDAGIIDKDRANQALKKLDSEPLETGEENPGLLEVLLAADLVVWFDTETGTIPCEHDKLVAEFANHSQGEFNPSALSETFDQRQPNEADAKYTLRFVFDNRLYKGELRNYGDWYDVERTVSMINRSLQDSDRKKCFIGLATRDQTASYVFADPELFIPLAREFHLPVSKNDNEGRNRGQAFEREVMEKLEGEATK